MRLFFVASAVLALGGCGQLVLTQPDGGRTLIHCDRMNVSVPVQVFTPMGQPAVNAGVTVTNQGNGRSFTIATNGQGIFLVPDSELGAGAVDIVVTQETDAGPPQRAIGRVTITCGDCGCSAFPARLSLTLQ
jgi:hypothetical protein